MKKYTLTEAHKAQLPAWRDRWIANALSTKPMDESERLLCREAVKGLYASANLTPPPDHRIVFVASPFILRFAGGFAAAIWHLRKTGELPKTRDATDAATDAATRDATASATYAATYAATNDATYDATRAAHSSWYRFPGDSMVKLSKALGLATFGLSCASEAYRMWQGGNQWSAWDSLLTFFRHVAKLGETHGIDYSKYSHWETLSLHSGPRIMHPEFCMISDRPSTLLVDDRSRPHCETGPFCEWRDGSALFALHGIRVPEWIVMTDPKGWTKEKVLGETNAEVRRAIIRKIGVMRAMQIFDAKVIHAKDYSGAKHFLTHEGRSYELLEIDFGTGGKRKYLKMKNASMEDTHIEAVHPDCKTVDQALGYRDPHEDEKNWRKDGYTYTPPAVLT